MTVILTMTAAKDQEKQSTLLTINKTNQWYNPFIRITGTLGESQRENIMSIITVTKWD